MFCVPSFHPNSSLKEDGEDGTSACVGLFDCWVFITMCFASCGRGNVDKVYSNCYLFSLFSVGTTSHRNHIRFDFF